MQKGDKNMKKFIIKEFAKNKINNIVYCYDTTSKLTFFFKQKWELSNKYFDVLEHDQEINLISEEEAYKITGSNSEELDSVIQKVRNVFSKTFKGQLYD